MKNTKASIYLEPTSEYVVDFNSSLDEEFFEFSDSEAMLVFEYRNVRNKYNQMLSDKLYAREQLVCISLDDNEDLDLPCVKAIEDDVYVVVYKDGVSGDSYSLEEAEEVCSKMTNKIIEDWKAKENPVTICGK